MQNTELQIPTAAQWEAVLAFRAMPILQDTRTALRRELRNPQVSFDSLVPIAERDPALCWHLLQRAVSHNPGCREQIHSVYNCLSLLGMHELVTLIKNLPTVDEQPKDPSEKIYQQALFTAHMAGCLAAQWASAKGAPTNTAYWSAMLAHSVLWPWFLLDKSSHNWLHFLSEGNDLITATKKVFGHSADNWQRLVKRHNLPNSVADIFRHDKLPEKQDWQRLRRQDPRNTSNGRKLIHLSQTESMLALTAAGTAWHLYINPEGVRSQRWLSIGSHAQGRRYHALVLESRAIQIEEARLRKSPFTSGIGLLITPHREGIRYPMWRPEREVEVEAEAEAEAPTIQTKLRSANAKPAVEASIESTAETVKSDTESLGKMVETKPSSTETEKIESCPTTPHETSQYATAESVKHGPAYLKKVMEQLVESPASFGDWHYLMQGALKGIHLGIGIDHSIVMLPSKNRSGLRTVYAENPEGLSPFSTTSIPLQVAPLLRQLMKQQAAVHITPETCERYFKGMPVELANALPKEMMLMSVHAGQDPIGIVIAANSEAAPIPKEQYQRFRQLCNTTSQGLASLRQLSAKAKASSASPSAPARSSQ